MTPLLRDRPSLTRSCALILAALALSALTVASPASAADPAPSTPAADGLIAGTSQPGASTHTDIVLSDVGPVAAPAVTVVNVAVTVGDEPVSVGRVQFRVNGEKAGEPVRLVNGMASLPVAEGEAGTYTFQVSYSGFRSGAKDYLPSDSSTATFVVTEPAVGCVGTAVCDEDIWAGSDKSKGILVISTPYTETSPLQLPPMTLQRNPNCLVDPMEYGSDAPFAGISVRDTRPGKHPWTVSAQAEDLLIAGLTPTTATASQRIDGQNLGLSNLAVTSTDAVPRSISSPLPAGSTHLPLPVNFSIFNNPSAPHVQGDDSGTLGLGGTPKRVVHANRGFGSSMFVGTLSITAPINTVQGTYVGTVTFTVLGS